MRNSFHQQDAHGGVGVRRLAAWGLGLGVGLLLSLPASAQEGYAPTAEEVTPIEVGAEVPDSGLRSLAGEDITLHSLVEGRRSVLIFYRGGWWPYCDRQLGQLLSIEEELKQLGFQVLAMSPDGPEKLQKTVDKNELTYGLVSDWDLQAARDFGLAFRLDDQTAARYKGLAVDRVSESGDAFRALPVPAVFVVDEAKTVTYRYYEADFKVRAEPDAILAAARAVAESGEGASE